MMTQEQIEKLNTGDIVRHVNGNAYIVISKNDGYATAIRTITVCNGPEWTLIKKHDWSTDEL